MKKQEAIKAIEDKWGFVPYGKQVFDELYTDDEEISEGLLNYYLNVDPYRPKNDFIIVGAESADMLKILNNKNK